MSGGKAAGGSGADVACATGDALAEDTSPAWAIVKQLTTEPTAIAVERITLRGLSIVTPPY